MTNGKGSRSRVSDYAAYWRTMDRVFSGKRKRKAKGLILACHKKRKD